MAYITLTISIISMLAGVTSACIAVKSKKECNKTLEQIREIKTSIYSGNNNFDNVNVSGGNNGVVAREIHGGVNNNGR